MTSNYMSSEVIEMAEDLIILKRKYERKVEILHNVLYRSQIIINQTQKKIDFLDFEKVRHTKLIEDISQILGDVRCKMQEDLDKMREICEDIPYLMGLVAMGV